MGLIRRHVDNPELILSCIALHAVLIMLGNVSKKIINQSSSGLLKIILTEIVSSFMFLCCICEKGLWYENVNETYFHVATAAQVIYFTYFMPGKANPLPILGEHGIMTMLVVFPFQILGALGGGAFMSQIYWKIGFLPFHSTITTGNCTSTLNIDQNTAIFIETGLVFLMIIAPEVEKALAKYLNMDQETTVMLMQSVLIAYVVKTFIQSTGALMNPLLALLINFNCISTPEHLFDHALTYWFGPMVLVFTLCYLKSPSSKKKLD